MASLIPSWLDSHLKECGVFPVENSPRSRTYSVRFRGCQGTVSKCKFSSFYSSFQYDLNWINIKVLEPTSFHHEHEKWEFLHLYLNSLRGKAQIWRRMTHYYSQLYKNWKVNIGLLDAKHYTSSKIRVKWFPTKNLK